MDRTVLTKRLLSFLDLVKYFGFRKIFFFVQGIVCSLIRYGSAIGTDMRLINKNNQGSPLLNRRLSRKLVRLFDGDEGHNLDFKTYFLGFGLIHYSIVRNLKPNRILCIGSRKGFVPAILALGCKDNHKGKVDFVDAGYGLEKSEKSWGGVGFWKKVDSNKHFSLIKVNNFIQTFVKTSKTFADRYPARRYDYIYIDGDHSFEGVKLDYELFWPRLNKYGFMVFHDMTARGMLDKGEFGVWRFWKQVKENKIAFNFPKKSGLGIVQKV